MAVRTCLEWQCSLCAVYAHSRQPQPSQEALVHLSVTPRHVDTPVFPAGSSNYDSQNASTLAEDFLHMLPLSNLPAPVSDTIALMPRSTDDNGRRRLQIATLHGAEACGVSLGRTSRHACTIRVAIRLRRLCWLAAATMGEARCRGVVPPFQLLRIFATLNQSGFCARCHGHTSVTF